VSDARQTPVSEFAQQVVAKRAGPSASATVLAAAALRTYNELVRVAAPLIGQGGVEALMSRAVHLARRQYPWLGSEGSDSPEQEEILLLRSLDAWSKQRRAPRPMPLVPSLGCRPVCSRRSSATA
jgi:hypothetical protein